MTIIINKTKTSITRGDDCPEKIIVVNDAMRGPPGLSNLFFFVRRANGPIGAHRAVISNEDGSVSYADTTNTLHLGKVLGITTASVVDQEEVTIIRGGLIEFEGWSFNVDQPVYLAVNGLLTQNPSVAGFSQIVGFAESPTALFVNLREPILLT
jgi:hypothetical protein